MSEQSFTSVPGLLLNLKPSDHLCCIYETEEEQRAVVTSYVIKSLRRGEKVIYIGDTSPVNMILGYLRDEGLDVDDFLARGQLLMSTSTDTYMRDGAFDPDVMIGFLRETMEQALAEGYTALSVTGEMTWALRGMPGSDRLIEYEAKLNKFFPGNPCSAICQYDRRRFDPAILQDVIHTHPIVLIGTQYYDNFYFVPPDAFLSNRPEARLQQWIQSLQDRKSAEEALHKSEAFLKQTQEITHVGGWEFDVLTAKVSWTDEVYAIYEVGKDYNSSDIHHAIEFYSPRDQEIIDRSFQHAVELGEPYSLELEFISAKGTHKWVRTSGQVERQNGKIVRVFGNIMDITASKLAADAVRFANEYNRSLIEASLDPLVTIGPDGQITDVNAATERVTGYSRAELIGTDFSNYFTDPELARAGYLQVFREGSVRDYALDICHRNGQTFSVLYNASVYRDQNGKVIGVFAGARDVTERKRAEDKIHELLREKELLLKEVHHRIKNNMMTIAGLLLLQMEAQDDESVKRALQDAESRVQSMMVLYDRLYRSENFKEISIREYFPPLLQHIISVFPRKNPIQLETRLDDVVLAPKILTPLGIILNELATNAMKYAFPDNFPGTISVSATLEQGALVVVFADNGVGLPASITLENSTGFGVQLVKMLAEQLDGTISLERTSGTKYSIRFPIS
jgi:PAS domain S-box-containing protein